MSRHKWSEDEVNYFLQLYRMHECLWNVRSPLYSNNALRETAFEDIRLKMLQFKNVGGLGPEQIKDKVLNLRSAYYRLRKTYKYSTFCPSERVGKWYKEIDLIVRHSKSSKRMGNSEQDPFSKKPMSQEAQTTSSVNIDISDDEEEEEETSQEEIIIEKSNPVSLVKLQSRIEIMNVLRKLYVSKVSQSYNIVYDILTKILQNHDVCLKSSVESCEHEMTKLGFTMKEITDGRKIIVEDAEQRFERYLYISKIRKFRINKPIIYLDERVINLQLKFEKLSYLRNGLQSDSSVMFLAVSKEGFLNGLFCSEATEDNFNKWVTDMLLGHLKQPSVIVLENSPIHGKMEDTCSITRYSTKNEMIKWLMANNIPHSPKFARPELFELIRKNKRETKGYYKIDRIIKSHGHQVLRLPGHFPDLNLSDVLWNAMFELFNCLEPKTKVKFTITSLQELQNKIFTSLGLSSINKRKWNDMEKILIMKENDIYQIDDAIENILETYTFCE